MTEQCLFDRCSWPAKAAEGHHASWLETCLGLQALTRPMILAFSSDVWKRPWPNLDAVSMNFSLHPRSRGISNRTVHSCVNKHKYENCL